MTTPGYGFGLVARPEEADNFSEPASVAAEVAQHMPRFQFAGDPYSRDESLLHGAADGMAGMMGNIAATMDRAGMPSPYHIVQPLGQPEGSPNRGLSFGADSGLQGVAGEALKHLSTLQDIIEQAPHRIKLMCFFGGLAVIVNGIFGVLNVFGAFTNIIFYIVNFYQVIFGVVTCISELHPGFLGQGDHLPDLVDHFQRWLHEWAKGLTLIGGRGLFYIFQGSLVIVSSSALSLGLIVGLYMLAIGFLCISLHFKMHPGHSSRQEDYVRVH